MISMMEATWEYTVIILESFCLVGFDFLVFVLVGGFVCLFWFWFWFLLRNLDDYV